MKAEGKCSNCQAELSLSRELGWSCLGKLCPVCGCETMKWVQVKIEIKKRKQERRKCEGFEHMELFSY